MSERRGLIVAANVTASRILTERTRTWGMHSVEVGTAALALEKLRGAEKFDVVMVDSRLPDMDGRKLAAAIREIPARAKAPLVLLSPQGQRENTEGLFKAVLTKPVKPSQLFDAFVEIFWPSKGAAATALTKPILTAPPEAEPVRVLFAGHKPENLNITLEQLGKLGCRADVAVSRSEILDAVRRVNFDVIFLDLHTSPAEGLETARQIQQALPTTVETWVVAVTNEFKPENREAFRAAGIDDHLLSPFAHAQLAAALERAKWRLPI